MGIIHVLTGPDHLSALATLSANIGNFEAFWYGVRWGIGHSIGLIIVGSILILIDYANGGENNDNDDGTIGISEYFESFCESIVGVFMVLLGLYGLRTAYRKHIGGTVEEGSNHSNDMSTRGNEENDDFLELSPPTQSSINVEDGIASMSLADVSYDALGTTSPQNRQNEHSAAPDFIHNHHHHHDFCGDEDDDCCCGSCNISKPILSLGIGIIHGIAGPGGVLGVIPAVQLHNWKLAIIYLGTFCLSSTLTMGTYAALYGSCTSYASQKNTSMMEYRIEMFSSGLSLFVGFLWLFLLSIGKLHDFFP
jgi:hypothetical protein